MCVELEVLMVTDYIEDTGSSLSEKLIWKCLLTVLTQVIWFIWRLNPVV